MQAYRITEWKQRYEVTAKSRPALGNETIEQLRKSPLLYVRFKVNGHALGPAYRRLVKMAYKYGIGADLATFGLFAKLLELAADQPVEFRGWILNEKQQPIYAEQITELLSIADIDIVKMALRILTDPAIGWLELTKFCKDGQRGNRKNRQNRQSSRTLPKNSGSLGGKEREAYINETKPKPKEKLNKNEGKETSNFQTSLSSDSGSVKIVRQKASLRLAEIFKPTKPADITTLRDILNQLQDRVIDTPGIFDDAIEQAKEAANRGKNPLAMFVALMKQEKFGYMPLNRRLLRK